MNLKYFIDIHRAEQGAAMLEYSLIAACIAVVAMAGVGFVGDRTTATINEVGNKLASANNPDAPPPAPPN